MSALARAQSRIDEGRLENGLTWSVWHEPADTVCTLQVWVRVGSSWERAGETGYAHLLEHLMFRGTEAVPDGLLDARMEAAGASINAATWLDYTFYTSTFPLAALPEVLKLEADRFAALTLTPEVFDTERAVVINERRQTVDAVPESRLGERLHAERFGAGPYAWPTIGWLPDLEAATLERVDAFRRAHYTPANTHVVLCGPIGRDEAAARVGDAFDPWTGPEALADHRVPAYAAGRRSTLALPIQSPRVAIGWPAPSGADPGAAACWTAAEILGGGAGARLPARLEIEDRSVLDVDVSYLRMALPALVEVWATLRPGVEPAAVEAAIREEVARLAQDGPNDDELEGTRRTMASHQAAELASTLGRAERMGESWIHHGDPVTGFRDVDALAEVTADDVRDACAAWLAEPSTTVVGVPE